MKKIIKIVYSHRILDGTGKIKYFLVNDDEQYEKLAESEQALNSKYYFITINQIDVTIAKFLTVEDFKHTEIIEFIKICKFLEGEL